MCTIFLIGTDGNIVIMNINFYNFRESQTASRSASDIESLVDSAPTSLDSTQKELCDDVQFGIRRLMEDLGKIFNYLYI